MNSSPLPLEIHDLTVSYHRRPVLYGVDLEIEEGSLVGIIGPNGAGKSTLIKTIMGIVPSRGGWVKIFGQKGKKSYTRVGYVPQRESVDWDFPVSVLDVVLMGRFAHVGWFKRVSKKDRSIASECLEKVNMLDFADRQIGKLSGGQQQRVFLARALAQESDLYLMDEPFAGVDAVTEDAIIELLRELKNRGKTLIVVHHDLSNAKDYFDQLILLNMRLIAHGEVEKTFTKDLLQKTYGGRLTVFTEIADQAANTQTSDQVTHNHL
jgi:manganese/zinc/iron transport system ATP- binding protein